MKLLEILEREDGCLSLPRLCAAVGFVMICLMMLAELSGLKAQHMPEFMAFVAGLFGFCYGSKHLDIKKAGAVQNAG